MSRVKGAMFGLDARIALAIFGALSVISGAALYSAIQDSKVTSYVTEMTELSKAVESYMLDIGTDIPKRVGLSYIAEVEELLTSAATGWSGPYFTSEYNATSKGFKTRFSDPDSIYVVDVVDTDSALGGLVHSGSSPCISSSTSCYYWVRAIRVDLAIAKAMDEKVDGVDNSEEGSLRYSFHSGTNKYFVWLRGPKTLSQY